MENVSESRCNCGCTNVVYYSDENQWEPECWECYANQPSVIIEPTTDYCVYVSPLSIEEEDDLPF